MLGNICLSLYCFFSPPSFSGCPTADGVPGPGIRSELQLRPTLQLWQRQSFNPLSWLGMEPASWRCRDAADPLVPQWELLSVLLLMCHTHTHTHTHTHKTQVLLFLYNSVFMPVMSQYKWAFHFTDGLSQSWDLPVGRCTKQLLSLSPRLSHMVLSPQRLDRCSLTFGVHTIERSTGTHSHSSLPDNSRGSQTL